MPQPDPRLNLTGQGYCVHLIALRGKSWFRAVIVSRPVAAPRRSTVGVESRRSGSSYWASCDRCFPPRIVVGRDCARPPSPEDGAANRRCTGRAGWPLRGARTALGSGLQGRSEQPSAIPSAHLCYGPELPARSSPVFLRCERGNFFGKIDRDLALGELPGCPSNVRRRVEPHQGIPAIEKKDALLTLGPAFRSHVQKERSVVGSKQRFAREVSGQRLCISDRMTAREHELHDDSGLQGA